MKIIFKNAVLTAKRIQLVSTTNISFLMSFREITGVYIENNIKPINTRCGRNAELLNVVVIHVDGVRPCH
jgi:hypothetical protein